MEDIIYCKDLHDPIESDKDKPEDMSKNDWHKQHRKTIGTIRQWVDRITTCFIMWHKRLMHINCGRNWSLWLRRRLHHESTFWFETWSRLWVWLLKMNCRLCCFWLLKMNCRLGSLQHASDSVKNGMVNSFYHTIMLRSVCFCKLMSNPKF